MSCFVIRKHTIHYDYPKIGDMESRWEFEIVDSRPRMNCVEFPSRQEAEMYVAEQILLGEISRISYV